MKVSEKAKKKGREAAVELYDQAMKLRAEGKSREAEKLLARIVSEYQEATDVVRRARVQGARPRQKDKPDDIQPALPDPDLTIECPGCGDTLWVDAQTLRVWCNVCEEYVVPPSEEKQMSGKVGD